MPGTGDEVILSFLTKEMKEGERIGSIPIANLPNNILGGMITMKFVMCYYMLKEKIVYKYPLQGK